MLHDEETLIEQLIGGSKHALSDIYKLYASRIYVFGIRYCKSREKVEELVSDTFLWLWNNRQNIRQKHSLKSLLFLRMRHFLINAYRETLHSPEYEDYLRYKERISNMPDDPLEYDDFMRQLHKAINQLPPMQARVVKMSKLEQHDNRTIARQLGIAEQTVKNLLSLSLKTLREQTKSFQIFIFLLFYVN